MSSLEIHGPAAFPFVLFTGEAVKDVASIAVLEAFNFEAFKLDGVKDFGWFALVAKFFHALFGVYNEGSVATLT